MKKVLSCFMLFLVIFSLSACGEKDLPENYYEECNFEKLKTFTAVTDIEVSSKDDSALSYNVYTYNIFENAEDLVLQYESYLAEYGFVMTSEVTSERAVFAFEGEEITVFPVYGGHGAEIKITIPCDSATSESRKELYYNAAVEAFNNDDYDKFFEYYDLFKEEYKDLETYRNYAAGIRNYRRGYFATAHSLFSECSEMKDAAEYLKKIEHYNGSYRYNNGKGSMLYIFVKNGEVAMEISSVKNDTVKDRKSVTYIYELVNRELPQSLADGTTHQLMIAFVNGSKTDYEYTFLEDAETGEMMVISYETNAYTTYNGFYEKYSDTAK